MLTKPQKIEYIEMSRLESFPGHPYRVELNDDMRELIKSIFKLQGITAPLLVWEYDQGKYYILSGHRRTFACEIINQTGKMTFTALPCLVYRNIDINTATIIMVDENAKRTELLPSEKGWAYRMKLEAMKRQGQRTDLTSSQLATKLNDEDVEEPTSRPMGEKLSVTKISEQSEESERQIHRYIRITYLLPPLLDMVDLGMIGFRAGVELSYLSNEFQEAVLETVQKYQAPNLKQASALKKKFQDNELTCETITSILSEHRLDDRVSFRLNPDQLDHLNELSNGTDVNRSELLRTLASNGQAVYVGKEVIGELFDLKGDIARSGNLLKAQLNKLDIIAQNPSLQGEAELELLAVLEENKQLHAELDRLRKEVLKMCEIINNSCNKLNTGIR